MSQERAGGTAGVDPEAQASRVGDALERARLITADQSRIISRYCAERHLAFGEGAVELGFIDQSTLELVLADHLSSPATDSEWNGEPIAFTDPRSREAEDYRSIRNALTLRWFKHPQGEKTLAIVSPDRREGRSVMAANLAVCLAQVGFRTLLIDADMRNPRQHELFGIDRTAVGLSSLLASRVQWPLYYPIASIPSLSVLPAGSRPPNPQELLLRGVLEIAVAEAIKEFDMILFDTPAAVVGSDYQLIGAAAGGALMVTQHAVTRTKRAKHQVEQCRGFGIRVVGSAMLGGT